MFRLSIYSFVFLIFGVGYSTHAQNSFEGKITYDVTYEHEGDNGEENLSKLPYRCIYITDGKSWRSVWKSEIGEDYTIIYNAELDSVFHLVKIGDNRLTIPYGTNNQGLFNASVKTMHYTVGSVQVTLNEVKRVSEPYDNTYFVAPPMYKALPSHKYGAILK
ncbi:MAG: hypothetical protein Salg2KO_15540 [Salibacteraceae bacterium]